EDTAPVPEVAVAKRWMKLPLPANYCAVDETDDFEKVFAEDQRRNQLGEGRQMLMPFINCADRAAFRGGAVLNFGYGSYAVTLKEGEPWVLPEDMPRSEFMTFVGEHAPQEFDAAALAPLFAETSKDEKDNKADKNKADDAGGFQSMHFRSTP